MCFRPFSQGKIGEAIAYFENCYQNLSTSCSGGEMDLEVVE